MISLLVCISYLQCRPVSGGSMNPARSLGPAIVSWKFKDIWIYITAPIAGGLAGVLLFRFLRLTHQSSNTSFSSPTTSQSQYIYIYRCECEESSYIQNHLPSINQLHCAASILDCPFLLFYFFLGRLEFWTHDFAATQNMELTLHDHNTNISISSQAFLSPQK